MEIYNESGKTKSPILRVSKAIGAILITASIPFETLANEKITAHIERANGNNEEIATNISLRAFIATSVYGEAVIKSTATDFSVICELANNGALTMSEDETLVISLTGLNSANTYTVNGIEMPVNSLETVFFTEKVVLVGQKNRKFDVSPFDECSIIGEFDVVKLEYATEEGNKTIELTRKELRAIAAEDNVLLMGSNVQMADTTFSVVGVITLEVFTQSSSNVVIVLRDIDKNN
jgi:hypothetical protein